MYNILNSVEYQFPLKWQLTRGLSIESEVLNLYSHYNRVLQTSMENVGVANIIPFYFPSILKTEQIFA